MRQVLVAGAMFLASGFVGLGQSSEEVMVERAIALGKSGQIDSALEFVVFFHNSSTFYLFVYMKLSVVPLDHCGR